MSTIMIVFYSFPNQLPKGVIMINDFKEKYPYVHVGTLEPMFIKDISTKNSLFAVLRQYFRIRVRHIMT